MLLSNYSAALLILLVIDLTEFSSESAKEKEKTSLSIFIL